MAATSAHGAWHRTHETHRKQRNPPKICVSWMIHHSVLIEPMCILSAVDHGTLTSYQLLITVLSLLHAQVALVTGASSGLGRHFAKTLAAHGARVIVAARRVDKLEASVAASPAAAPPLSVHKHVNLLCATMRIAAATSTCVWALMIERWRTAVRRTAQITLCWR
jgi:short chain dehydrogenase